MRWPENRIATAFGFAMTSYMIKDLISCRYIHRIKINVISGGLCKYSDVSIRFSCVLYLNSQLFTLNSLQFVAPVRTGSTRCT